MVVHTAHKYLTEAQCIMRYNDATIIIHHSGMRGHNFNTGLDRSRQAKSLMIVRRPIMDLIKVSANSRTAAVAGAIAGVVREHHRAEVQAIGAGAINQALKALILATGYLKNDGIFVSFVPEFADITIEDHVRT